MKMIFLPTSSNKKTGDIMQSYSSRSTCPKSCVFKNNGCYAEGCHTKMVWDRCEDKTDARYVINGEHLKIGLLEGVFNKHRKNPTRDSILFRHNVAGDIAIEGTSLIDANRVDTIAGAIEGANKVVGEIIKGYTFTHCMIDLHASDIIHDAAHKGFLINASCETVEEVKHAKALGINAVIASVDPKETEKELKAVGLYGAQCPAQVKEGMDCNHCQLCAKNRKVVIIFGIHGSHKGKARKAIQIHRAKASNLANLK